MHELKTFTSCVARRQLPGNRFLKEATAWCDSARLLFVVLTAAFILAASQPAPAFEPCTARTSLLKNREYARAVLQGIRDARATILVSSYLFKISNLPGNQPRKIAEELINARRRGVKVSVIMERSADENDFLNMENQATADLLERNNVTVRFDSPRKTSHAKVIVIDSRYVYLGSHNLTHSALSRNNELSVLIDSPDLAKEVTEFLGGSAP